MSTRIGLYIVCSIAVLAAAPLPAHAQWIEDGAGVCTIYGNQYDPSIIPDGYGGAFIAWYDARAGAGDIYAQRIDARGNTLWTDDGVPVCTDPGYQYSPFLVADGSGGVIIVWRDDRNATIDIYSQRLNGDGTPLWASDGIAVCAAAGNQVDPQIATDGAGGAIIAWRDTRSNPSADIYAQRIDGSGTALWTAGGVAVRATTNATQDIHIIADGNGNAILAWEDMRSGNLDIYAQKIYGSTGNPFWAMNGVAVCSETGHQQRPELVLGRSFDAIITWHDPRGADMNIYAQRISMDGFAMWTANGIAVCAATGNQNYPDITTDGEGGAFITWEDGRSGSYTDVYASRIDIMGNPLWATDGILICADYYYQGDPRIAADGEGGVCITWRDSRMGNNDVYAQRLSGSGSALWEANGVPVCGHSFGLYDPKIITDGSGGALIVWEDTRDYYDIYAQRIERNGYWGYPAAAITSVRDVPGDQGGSVNIAWDASRLDPWPAEDISYYSIWRAIDEAQALSMAGGGSALMLEGVMEFDPSVSGPVIRREMLGGGAFYWEKIMDYYMAEHLETYSYVAPTLFDSTGVCSELHYFQVIAHGQYSDEYWISDPDSGYSVDNLAPAAPLGLAGEQSYSPEGLQLTWDPNSEADLAGYNIYRGTSDSFVPGPGNFVTSTPDTASFDDEWSWDTGYWYKVAAFDIHGNESTFAVLSPDMLTGDEPMPVPDATFLAQNYPNPFNPNTSIAFGLKERGYVALRVYNAAGRLIRTLADGTMHAGTYEITWNGFDNGGNHVSSGVYFYRLTAKEFEETKKMILLR